MNIRQIEIFKAIMDTGSVTEAADRLHVSQPTASKHLRLLEESLGLSLFQRTGNRLVPRPEALALHDQTERLYAGVAQLGRFAENLKHFRHGEISVAAMPLIAHRWLPGIIAGFLQRFPSVSVSFPVRSSLWIAQAVASGRVDIGIGLSSGEEPGVRRELLLALPLVCVMPADHPLAGAQVVQARDLKQQSLIALSNFDRFRLLVEVALEQQGVMPRRRVDTFTTYVACELVRQGVGVAIVDQLTAKDFEGEGIVWRPFESPGTMDIHMLWPVHRPQSELASRFVVSLKEAAAQVNARGGSFRPTQTDRG